MILWFCTLLLAWSIAQLYQQPQFLWLIPVVGLGTVISGFNSTSVFTLNRNMAFRQLAIFELSGQSIGIVVMIVWAWFSPTIWAILMGSFASQILQLVWSHYWNSGSPNRLIWNQEVVHRNSFFWKVDICFNGFNIFCRASRSADSGKITDIGCVGRLRRCSYAC
ncbi:oligosaccharide flippase family protein [Microcoleus sp. T2B6]|uniref:oligosaccharide flippase family protein n=1 Tax=Microcoleus sp. T2B6 TaxID=3055424 RepID=UPI002FCEF92B